MRAVVAAATAGLVAQPALAQSTWTPTAAGTTYLWDGAGNWSTLNPPDGVDAVANLNNNIAGAQTIGLNAAIRTLGTLNLGDADGSAAFTLSGSGNLVFDVTTGNAALNVANTNLAQTNTVATAVTLSDPLVVTQNSFGNLAISGAVDGAGTLVKAGTGNVTLSGTNTFTGGVTLNAGTLTLGSAAALGSGTLTINGGTLNASAALALSTNNAQSWAGDFTYLGTNTLNLGTGAVTLTGNRSVNVAASTLTVGGPIGGAFSLTKAGAGTLALTGTNTYTGATVLSRGTLALDFSASAATTNIVAATSALQATGAATLQVTGKANTTNGQTFASTTLAGGQLSVVATANATANPLLVAMGTIARSGTNLGTIDFTLPAGTQSATNGITVGTTANGTGGIIGGWATVGSDWATVSGGVVVANTAYTTLPTAATTATTTNYVATASTTLAGAQSINSLKFVPSAAATIALGGNAMTFTGTTTAAPGGLLYDGTAAAGTISGTGIIGAGAANEFIVNARAGTLTIGAPIIGAGAGSLTKAGGGALLLTAASTYTGGTRLNGGTLQLGNATALGTGGLTIYGGTTLNVNGALSIANPMTWAGDFTYTGTNTLTTSGAVTMTGDRTVTVSASTLTVGGVTGAFPFTKAGAGTLVITGASTFTNPLITGGALQANNNTALGPATNTLTITSGGTGRVQINGGVTLGNNVVVQPGAVGASGAGLIQSVGTGQATLTGTVTLFGQTANGGVFLGGTAAGNELVLTGAINGAVPGIGMSQRDGRVIYRGGGNLTGGFVVTNTAIVGATNGLPVGLSPTLGGSGNATLDLASQGAAGFDQSLVGLTFGNGTLANAFAGTVTLGARTLSLTGGDVTSISNAGQNVTHVVTATTGGINFGSAARNIVVPDTLANDDMVFDKVALGATGGLTKTGAGTLVLRNVTSTGALAVTGGTIATSTAGGPAGNAFTAAGGTGNTLTVPSLTFGTGTAVRLNVGATGGDLITATTALVNPTTAGVTFRLTQTGGVLVPNGTYDLIKYGGTSPGLAGFTIGSFGHATAALVDTGTAIAVQVTGNDRVVWDATTNGTWDVNTTANWKLQTAGTSTNYLEGDDVLFQDNPTGATAGAVTLAANVAPSNVRFNNTAATPYTVSAGTAIGITGPTGLTKDGTGTATVRLANTYTGPTAVNAGTLVLDHDVTGNVVLNAASAVSVAPGATLRLQRNDGGFTFANPISGAGLVELQPHVSTGSTTAQGIVLSGNNAGFTGTLRLLAPASATYRITSVTPAALGSATVEVQSGAQVFTAANQTYTNNITIAGTGFADSAGNIGALRLEGGSNWAGNVVINGSARIGAHSATATISGNVSGGNAEFNATNFNNSYTVILTGTNSYGTTVIGGQNTQTAGVPTMRLNVGAGGTTGTLGTGAVTINGDGANGVLGFDRSDGYTLAQTITGAGSTITRTFVDFDTLGTGFASNGNAITLGAATSGGGGTLRAGQSRANTVTTFNSAVTGENLFVGSAANNATLNVVAGATVAANAFYLGNAAGMSGTVNQTGGAVNVTGQLRVSHFGTNTSTYNLSGGTLTLTGASPTLTPSTAAAGGANATGDNNINGTATATIHGGGVYIGIDGTGIFNHTGGTLTTNWIVLDNRGDTTGGVNMPDGIDRYTLDGAANPELRLRSTWGLIARNASTAVTFGQGTVTVDNTGGTSATTGNNITVPLDATIDTVAGKTTTLNLNTSVASPSNALTFTRDVRGSGTLALTGGGTVNLSTTGTQTVSPAITAAAGGTNLNKLGAGATTLTGSLSGFAGNVTVTAGRLNLPSTALGGGNVTVADGAALAGEPSGIGTLTLGGSAGATILFDPTTARSITVTNLVVNGTTAIDVTAAPVGSGPFDVVTYANRSGAGGFSIANPSNYRTAPTVTDTGTAIQISVAAGKALTWTGSASGAWNINGAQNWVDQSATPDVFFSGDAVTFPEGGANPSVALTGLIAPASVAVTSATTNYTFTSSANNLITGTTGIAKTGASTLTLVGANTYSGTTSVGGGTVVVSAANSLGDGSATNGIALSGGGRLSTTAAIDLGTRPVSVGAGGGSLSFNNAAAGTVTVGGSLAGTGANALSFHTAAAGAGTFVLTGSNAGYAGRITVDAASTAGTTLRFASSAAVPGTGSVITLNYPAAATTSGTASGIDLPGGVTIPAGVTLNMTSFNTAGNISQRTQIVSNGDNTVAAPITVSGNSVIQFNPGTGALTLAGPVTETTAGAFTGNFFLRGASTATSVLSGTVNLPTAGASVSKTDSGTWLITSTGNVFPNAAIAVGTLRTGAAGALPANVNVTLGQNDANAATLDLNGFSQTVGSMTSNPTTVGANTTGKAVTSATAATFTINQSTATTYAGLFTGALSLVKTGSGALTLPATTSTFTGNVQVDGGSLVAAGVGSNTAGSLGNPSVAGRTVTVSAAGTLSFSSNNVFGNGVGNANLPAVVLNGGTLSGTRYNVLGDVTLNTGATLTQASTDAGGYAGFQFRGAVTVGGVSASTIATTNAKANHLAAGTVFTVADVTGSPAADLTVSAPLADQSADFASAAGGLTKAGAGTMLLTGASTYTGATTVTAGVLQVAAGGTGSLAATAVAVKAGGTLAGTGSIAGPVSVEASGVLAPGSGVATLATGSLTLAAGSTLALDVTGPNATDYDRVSVTGAVTAGGNISVTPSGTVQPTDVLTVVLNDAADAVGGSFATVNGVALVATGPNVWTTAGPDVFGNVYTVNTAGGDGNDVTITGVPEPTSAAALGLAAVGLLAGRRRRRRSAGNARR